MVKVVRLEEDRVKLGSLDGEGGLGDAGEKVFFPGGSVWSRCGHGEEEVVAVFKKDGGEATLGGQRSEEGEGVYFVEDAGAVAVPVFFDTKLGEGLLEDEVWLAFNLSAEDEIGDAAEELFDVDASWRQG